MEEKIKELLDLMDKHDLAELEIEEEGRKLRLRKREDLSSMRGIEMVPRASAPVLHGAPAPEAVADSHAITSPMVGTFYRSPNPDADVYVQIEDFVEPDTIVGIVEAMKVMNEIKAGVSGVIKKALVEDGSPVEFGQKLFVIEPA